MMRNLADTATVIASIAVAIVLLFMAPKGFHMSGPSPIVASHTSGVASSRQVTPLGPDSSGLSDPRTD